MPARPLYTHPSARLVLSHPVVYPRVNSITAIDDLGFGLPESERHPDDEHIEATGPLILFRAAAQHALGSLSRYPRQVHGGLFLQVAGTRLQLGENGVRCFTGLGMGAAGDKGGSVWWKLGDDVWTLWLEGATASNLATLRDLIAGLPLPPLLHGYGAAPRTRPTIRPRDAVLRNSVVVVDESSGSVVRVLKQGVVLQDDSASDWPPRDSAFRDRVLHAVQGMHPTGNLTESSAAPSTIAPELPYPPSRSPSRLLPDPNYDLAEQLDITIGGLKGLHPTQNDEAFIPSHPDYGLLSALRKLDRELLDDDDPKFSDIVKLPNFDDELWNDGVGAYHRVLDADAARAATDLGGLSRPRDEHECSRRAGNTSTDSSASLDTLHPVTGFLPHRSRSHARAGSAGSTTRARSRSSDGTFLTAHDGGSVASRRRSFQLPDGSNQEGFAAAINALDSLAIGEAAHGKDDRFADSPAQGHNTASGVLLSFLAGDDVTASTISPHAPESAYVPASAPDLWSLLTWFTLTPIDLLRSSTSWLSEMGIGVLAWVGYGPSSTEPISPRQCFPSEDDFDYVVPSFDPASLASTPRPVARRKRHALPGETDGGSRFSVYHYDASGIPRAAYFGKGRVFRGAV